MTFANGDGTHSVKFGSSPACALPCTKTFPYSGTFSYLCGVHPEMTGTVTVGTPPTVSISSPPAGATVSGTLTVDGSAAHTTEAIASVQVRLGPTPFQDATIEGSGKAVTWSTTIDASARVNGFGTASTCSSRRSRPLRAPCGRDRIPSTSRTPRASTFEVTRISGGTSTTREPTKAPVAISYRNNGNVPSGDFQILLEYMYKDSWHPVDTFEVASIPASTTEWQMPVTWDSGGFFIGEFPIRATIDPSNAIAESDERNNVKSRLATFTSASIPPQDVRDPDTTP